MPPPSPDRARSERKTQYRVIALFTDKACPDCLGYRSLGECGKRDDNRPIETAFLREPAKSDERYLANPESVFTTSNGIRIAHTAVDGLPVHISSMSDLENGNLMTLVVNVVDDSISALPYAVTVDVSGELLRTLRTGIGAERSNPLYDSRAICFRSERLDFLCG